MPKVSIIVPMYNTEKYISRCLNSLVNQTLKDIEIICVNDGSLDNTMAIVNDFAANDNRIKTIEQENKKQGAARNAGCKIATGEYLGFIDSDDWVDLDYFEKLYCAAKKYNADLALGTNIRIGNGKTKKRLEITQEKFIESLQEMCIVSNQVKNPCPTNKIYKKSLLDDNKILWPEGVYCEDKLFTIQALYFANGMVTVPNANYYYYRNPNSTVLEKNNKTSKKHIKDKKDSLRNVLNFLKEKSAPLNDKMFWAIKKDFVINGVTIFKIEESFNTERVLLCGLKLMEFKTCK